MTLCIVNINPTRALIAVDTQCGQEGTEYRREASKLLATPHNDFVIAARGLLPLLTLTFGLCVENSLGLDGLREHADEVFRYALAQIERVGAEQGLDSSTQTQIIAVGWSDQHQAMMGTTYERSPGAHTFVRNDINGWRVHGGEANWGPMPVDAPETPESIAVIARWQVANFRKADPKSIIGGRLITADVNRGFISFTTRSLDEDAQTNPPVRA